MKRRKAMYKELEIEKADGSIEKMPFKACGTTGMRYRQFTGHEIMKDLDIPTDAEHYNELDNAYSRLAYVMNKQATAKSVNDMQNLSEEDYINWMEEIASVEFVKKSNDLLDIYLNNKITTSDAKKKVDQQTES